MKINPSGFGDVGLAHRFFGFALNMSEAGGYCAGQVAKVWVPGTTPVAVEDFNVLMLKWGGGGLSAGGQIWRLPIHYRVSGHGPGTRHGMGVHRCF